MTNTIDTGELTIRPLDPFDEAEMRRFHEIAKRAEQDDGRSWNAFWPYELLAGRIREPTADRRVECLCAFDRDRMVGVGMIELWLLDNLDKAHMFPAVEPELRGNGIGGLLLERLADRAREAGRSLALSGAAVNVAERHDAPVHRFAARHGFRLANTEIYRILPLPVADGLLTRLAEESAPHHADYRIETYVDDLPAEYLASYSHLRNQLGLDAPTGDIEFEAEGTTPEIMAERMDRDRRAGRRTYLTLAVHDGETVAHSDLFVAGDETHAHQMGTLVRRDHRGHRLGTAVKIANLRALQQAEPAVTEVHTGNAETNRWMVDINVRLGFEVVGVLPEYLRAL